jgi:hypothetical protein
LFSSIPRIFLHSTTTSIINHITIMASPTPESNTQPQQQSPGVIEPDVGCLISRYTSALGLTDE